MKILILFLLIILMISIMYAYYRHQNNKIVIGGKISKAKTIWLGYAMFHYFILPWWFPIFINENADHTFAIYTILAIFYFRMLLQMLLMFVTRNWSPVIGITYNILASVVFIYLLIDWIELESMSLNHIIIIIYILKLIAILLTDTYYARSFHLLVGEETKGKKAIWFASDEEKFKRINRITARNNVIFILVSLVMLLLLLIYDIY